MKTMLLLCLLVLISCVKGNSNTTEVENSKGEKILLTFQNETEELTVEFQGKKYLLKQVPMGSGIRYESKDHRFSEWHGEIQFSEGSEVLFQSP